MPKTTIPKKRQISLQLLPEFIEKLKRLAGRRGVTRGVYIQDMIREAKEEPKNSGDKNV